MKEKHIKKAFRPSHRTCVEIATTPLSNWKSSCDISELTREPYYPRTGHSVQSWHSASAPGRPELGSPYSCTCWCSLTGLVPLTCEKMKTISFCCVSGLCLLFSAPMQRQLTQLGGHSLFTCRQIHLNDCFSNELKCSLMLNTESLKQSTHSKAPGGLA